MSFFRIQASAVRRKLGQSATAAAAYRSASLIVDERTNTTHDYLRRGGVLYSVLVLPHNAPDLDRAGLWNMAEAAEKRKDAQVAREFKVGLPIELSAEERLDLVEAFADTLVERYGVAADLAVHAPNRRGDDRNIHAHLLLTTRRLGPEGLGAKTRILDDMKSGEIERVRELWADLVNVQLMAAGIEDRVTELSYRRQGSPRLPTVAMGPAATAMERRGVLTDKGDYNDAVKRRNAELEPEYQALARARDRLFGLRLAEAWAEVAPLEPVRERKAWRGPGMG
jgi:ATP-dependent exoDNAse (exonuclease V) alpha subunit